MYLFEHFSPKKLISFVLLAMHCAIVVQCTNPVAFGHFALKDGGGLEHPVWYDMALAPVGRAARKLRITVYTPKEGKPGPIFDKTYVISADSAADVFQINSINAKRIEIRVRNKDSALAFRRSYEFRGDYVVEIEP